MADGIEVLLGGLALGALYALVGLGLNIVFATSGVINFANGEFGMVAVVVALGVHNGLGLSIWIGLAVGMLVAGFVACAADLIAVKPLERSSQAGGLGSYGWLVTTLGVSIVLQNVAAMFFGTESKLFPRVMPSGSVTIFDAKLRFSQLTTVAIVAVVILTFGVVLRETQFGRNIRAIADNPVIVSSFGVRKDAVRMGVVLVSGLIVAVAALLSAPQTFANPFIGTSLLLNGFVAIVLGGLGNIVGGLVGGLVLGLTYAISGRYGPLVLQSYIPFIMLITWITLGSYIRIVIRNISTLIDIRQAHKSEHH
jgi:branched-chain amino acid transport system permease protein